MQVFETKLQTLLTGTQKELPATGALSIDGVMVKQTDIVAKLTTWLQLYAAVDDAKAASKKAQVALTAVLPEAHTFFVNYGRALKQFFGVNSPFLGSFGLAAKPRKARTSVTNVVASAKAAATRKVRGTMSKVAKAALHAAGATSVTIYDASGVAIAKTGPTAKVVAVSAPAAPVAVTVTPPAVK